VERHYSPPGVEVSGSTSIGNGNPAGIGARPALVAHNY
jgi:hypothetical protein